MRDEIKPVTVDKATWFYPEKRGILVVHEFRDKDGRYHFTDQFLIPWAKIDAAKKRKPK